MLGDILPLAGGNSLPNPLLKLPALLDEVRSLKVSVIHGDMNMENILVDPTTGDPSLIDFSEARQDHILHDFLRLETEVLTKLIPNLLARYTLNTAEMIPGFYEQLHAATFHPRPAPAQPPHSALARPLAILQTLRKTARQFLFDQDDCTEYYQGLIFYMLGALKFRNLSEAPEAPRPKQAAFWGAAAVAGLLEALQTLPADEIKPGALPALPNPYRGLQAFREEDAAHFFGRERITAELCQAVRSRGLVAVVGPSGSGKSSVVQAGLIPQLRAEKGWQIAVFRPGDQPFYNLAGPLLDWLEPQLAIHERLFQINQMAGGLQQGQLNLRDLVAALARRNPNTRWLLVTDQFEELYTQFPAKDLRRRFVDTLLSAVNTQPTICPSCFVLVLTLRADFMGQALSYRPLADALQNADLKLGPMEPDELVQAIEAPARQQGVEFEGGLVARILNEVGDEPGNLPLLEFALAQLWAEEQHRRLTHAAYEAIGGVSQALAHHAEAVYRRLRPEGERLRRIFIQLVQPGEGAADTRRQATRAEVGEDNWTLVTQLAGEEARLVVTGQPKTLHEGQVITMDTAEIVHEALLDGWDRLRDWMVADRKFRVCQERVRVQQEHWQVKNCQEEDLLHGSLLSEAEEWLAERATDWSEAETAFIMTSLARRDQAAAEKEAQLRRETETAQKLTEEAEARRLAETQRAETQAQAAVRLRWQAWWLAGTGVMATILAVMATIFGLQAGQNAEVAQTNANLAATRQMEAQIQADLAATRAVEALIAQETAVAEQHIAIGALEREARQRRLAQFHILLAQAENLAYDELAVLLAIEAIDQIKTEYPELILGGDTGWRLQNVLEQSRWLATLSGHEDSINEAIWSPDGQQIVTASDDGTAKIWDAQSGVLALTLTGHERAVRQTAWSLDGLTIVTASEDGTAKIWDSQTGEVRFTLTAHTGKVYNAAWSPDGQRIITAGEDGTAKIWDAEDGMLILTLTGHERAVRQVTWSPDGQRIVTASEDETAKIWDAEDGMLILTLTGHEGYVLNATWSPDGQLITTSAGFTAIVWDARSGALRFTLDHGAPINDVTWSPDGQQLSTTGFFSAAKVWDTQTGELLFTLPTADLNVAWSSDGQWIATAHRGGRAKVWDGQNGNLLFTLSGHHASEVNHAAGGVGERRIVAILSAYTGDVNYVAWSPDGQRIVTASEDGLAKVWDARSGNLRLMSLTGESEAVWSPDGQQLATAGRDGTTKVWETWSQALLLTLTGHTNTIYNVAWRPDGQRIVTVSGDGTAKVWDTQSGELLFTLTDQSKPGFQDAAWSSDGQRLVTVSGDGTAKVWDAQNGELLFTLTGYKYKGLHWIWSPNEERMVTFGENETIKVWDTQSGELLFNLTGYDPTWVDWAWSPNGERMVIFDEDKIVKVWDIRSGELLFTLAGHTDVVEDAAWSPDGKWIVTTSRDGTAKIWDARTGAATLTLSSHTSSVFAAAWSPDGQRIVTASADETAKIWNAQNGKLLFTLAGHEGQVIDAAWSPYGQQILTVRWDRVTNIWNVQNGELLSALTGNVSQADDLAWSPDERRIVNIGLDGAVRIHFTGIEGPGGLLAFACSKTGRNMTQKEWAQYMGAETPYRKTCPNRP